LTGFDVKRSLQTASSDGTVGREADAEGRTAVSEGIGLVRRFDLRCGSAMLKCRGG
jgi:hypothetical protein